MVGALLALASGKAERRQVHPLKLAGSVNSVSSVGEYTQQEVLCKSVKSVGDHPQQTVL